MKYNRFEELPVWNASIDLAVAVYTFSCSTRLQRTLQFEGSA